MENHFGIHSNSAHRMIGSRLQSASNRNTTTLGAQKPYQTGTTVFQLNQLQNNVSGVSKTPYNGLSAVIKTIHSGKGKSPTPNHLKSKENENVLPNYMGMTSNPNIAVHSQQQHQQQQAQHLMVGPDYRAGRKIGLFNFLN